MNAITQNNTLSPAAMPATPDVTVNVIATIRIPSQEIPHPETDEASIRAAITQFLLKRRTDILIEKIGDITLHKKSDNELAPVSISQFTPRGDTTGDRSGELIENTSGMWDLVLIDEIGSSRLFGSFPNEISARSLFNQWKMGLLEVSLSSLPRYETITSAPQQSG